MKMIVHVEPRDVAAFKSGSWVPLSTAPGAIAFTGNPDEFQVSESRSGPEGYERRTGEHFVRKKGR